MIMNKVLLIFKCGEVVPFLIIRCDFFESHDWGFFFYRNGEKHILHVQWDFISTLEMEDDNDRNEIMKIFSNFEQQLSVLKGK